MTLKITKIFEGKPELCPRCAGRGHVPDDMFDRMRCPHCKGDRTVVWAEVEGKVQVRVTAEVGDEL
jgi:DnaJ-class molecular chaperone